jgi:parallel beta-helix repeat protein
LAASENVISGNNFTGNNVFGIYILNAHSNLIVGNSFIENNCPALRLSTSINNTFYHNNFIDNHVESGLQVLNPWLLGSGDTEANTWDNGHEGNYWSDYALRYPNADQLNSSGTWDRQYFINEVNIDRFPLTEAFTINEPEPNVPDVVSDFPIWIPLTIVLVSFTAVILVLFVRRRKLHPPLKEKPT